MSQQIDTLNVIRDQLEQSQGDVIVSTTLAAISGNPNLSSQWARVSFAYERCLAEIYDAIREIKELDEN